MRKAVRNKFQTECEEAFYSSAVAFIEAGTAIGFTPQEAISNVGKCLIKIGGMLNGIETSMNENEKIVEEVK